MFASDARYDPACSVAIPYFDVDIPWLVAAVVYVSARYFVAFFRLSRR